MKGEDVGFGIIVLVIGLIIRCPVAFFAVFNTDLNLKERLFIMMAWSPKATVQAALGGILLGMAEEEDDDEFIEHGELFLTIAVLSILLTAPLGAILTATFGPRLLQKSGEDIVSPQSEAEELRENEGEG